MGTMNDMKVIALVAGLCGGAHAVTVTPAWDKLCDDNGLEGSCEVIKFSPDGSLIGTVSRFSMTIKGSGKNRVKMWNSSGGLVWKGDHDFQVKYGGFSPDGKVFVSAGDDKKAKVWESKTGKLLKTMDIGSTSDAAAFTRSGTHLAVAAGSTVRMYKADDWSFTATIRHGGGEVNAIDFSPGDAYMATGAADKQLKIWKMPAGTLLKTLKHNASIKSVAISPDGKVVVSGDSEGITKVWSMPDGALLKTLNPFAGHVHKVSAGAAAMDWPNYMETVTFTPDGKYLATGAHDRRIRLYRVSDWKMELEYNTQPGKPEKNWHTHQGRLNVEDIDFSRDGKFMGAASEDGRVYVYRITGVGAADKTPTLVLQSGVLRMEGSTTENVFQGSGITAFFEGKRFNANGQAIPNSSIGPTGPSGLSSR